VCANNLASSALASSIYSWSRWHPCYSSSISYKNEQIKGIYAHSSSKTVVAGAVTWRTRPTNVVCMSPDWCRHLANRAKHSLCLWSRSLKYSNKSSQLAATSTVCTMPCPPFQLQIATALGTLLTLLDKQRLCHACENDVCISRSWRQNDWKWTYNRYNPLP